MPLRRCVLAVLVIGGIAKAENLETELRLKRAGVDADLRRAVHVAIANGVKRLRAAQRSDGSFQPGSGLTATEPHPGAWTALCGLALRHSGLPDGIDASRRALRYLVAEDGRPRPELLRTTYSAATSAMLAATQPLGDALAPLGAALAAGQTPDGWWNYTLPSRGVNDLSNTQFAVLGLSACRRAGVPVDAGIWKRHVDALLRSQMADGSWSYSSPIPWSYPTGTFMGTAGLVLAAEHAGARDAIGDAQRRAMRAMARDVRATLDAFDQGWLRDYYAMYAMERACVFLELEEVGGRAWYVDGARSLVRIQEKDGSWSGRDYTYWPTTEPTGTRSPARAARGDDQLRPSMEATAFALLFLARAPEHDRVTTPRPIDAVITQSDGVPAPAAAKPDPAPLNPIPIDLAAHLITILEAQLKDGKAGPKEVESSLLAVVDASSRLKGEDESVKAWLRRAEDAYFVAFRYRMPPLEDADRVNALAARAIGGLDASVSPRFIKEIEQYIDSSKDGATLAVVVEAFSTLARLNRIESMRWLRDRMARKRGTVQEAEHAVAALDAMTEFRGVSGRERHATFELLLRSCPRPETGGTPSQLVAAHVRALQWLAEDPETRLPPRRGMPTCGWIVTVDDFENWFHSHGDPKRAPWGH